MHTDTRRAVPRWMLTLVAVLVLGLLAAACAEDEEAVDDEEDEPGEEEPADEEDEADADPADEEDDGEDVAEDAEDGDFDWDRHEGETIRVALNQHPWQEEIEPLIPEFEELTGITVEADAQPEEQFRQRVTTELTARSDDIDVFMTSALQEGGRYHDSGWYEDLYPYLEDDSLTADDYDFDDMADRPVADHEQDGELIGMPIQIETDMLFYREDVLDEHGLEPPETLEELEEVAAEIDDPDGMRAFATRGRTAAAVTKIAAFLYAHGADWSDDEGMADFDSPEGVEAFEYYGRLLGEYGPSGVINNSWEENIPLFQQGEVAMLTDASVFSADLIDPDESAVADDVGFAPVPEGPGGHAHTFWAWAIAISSASENKEPAWYFVQWATSPEVVQQVQDAGVTGARESTEYGDFYPDEWVEVFEEQLPEARRTTPDVVPVPEVRDAIGEGIVRSIETSGEEAEAAAEAAAEDFNRIVEQE
ncbi:sugar ABC transporter substrate-binding protein [Egibacter rhizosphaerae]|uniref:Sugar ABC transporter substrate-binding protein n=1 Tax=Egibacter rhizosphaerae TaxID=1670831 RepID=A0A411YE05_9ACTN|nr:sugar ABC transporter substrate-binding protein [Egibacter rhizosphaerae]QBI19469.1 sugar ABC transporter substrate-binding protein [Egibacter rhizosphaerae]